MKHVLDACALLAAFNKEAGWHVVDDLVKRCKAGEIELFISAVQLLEVYYDRRRVKGAEYADRFLEDVYASCLHIVDSFPKPLIREAGRLKTSYKMSLADTFACATAISLSAALVTKDHEIEAVEQHEKLPVLWIA
jgi:predicted nucleic acid-binding protein